MSGYARQEQLDGACRVWHAPSCFTLSLMSPGVRRVVTIVVLVGMFLAVIVSALFSR